MNARENYLTAARGGRPEYVPSFPRDCNIFMPDFWMERRPDSGTDLFNVKWVKNDAGEMPDPSWHAIEEISQWRETVRFPDPASMDWEGMAARFEKTKDPEKVNIAMLNTNGLFLIPINMIGWENLLCAIFEETEEVTAFVEAITAFLIEVCGYIGRYIQPDIIFGGDDFASTRGPFISREVFREIYKPRLARIGEAIHQSGALYEFHCCGNCQFLIEEFLDLGADICQLPMPNEQLLADKKKFGSRLVLTGGWDRRGPGSMPGAPEEAVRESVRTAIDTYGADGALIFWDGGIVGTSEDSQNKMRWVTDELEKYGRRCYQ